MSTVRLASTVVINYYFNDPSPVPEACVLQLLLHMDLSIYMYVFIRVTNYLPVSSQCYISEKIHLNFFHTRCTASLLFIMPMVSSCLSVCRCYHCTIWKYIVGYVYEFDLHSGKKYMYLCNLNYLLVPL